MIGTSTWIRITLAAGAFAALAGCSVSSPTLQETRALELSVAAGTDFVVDAGAGSMQLEGEAGRSLIEVEAEIWQVSPNDDYTLTLEADGDGVARLVARHESGLGMNTDRIDLSIVMPESLNVRINDGSGSIRVSDLRGNLDIEDGSGSIGVARIGGGLTVDDGSGSLTAEDIGGSIVIDDGSGSITIDDAGGDVTIDDGSGSITVRNAAGVVTVDDGSGSINVDGAADFELVDDGSGSVNLENVGADAR